MLFSNWNEKIVQILLLVRLFPRLLKFLERVWVKHAILFVVRVSREHANRRWCTHRSPFAVGPRTPLCCVFAFLLWALPTISRRLKPFNLRHRAVSHVVFSSSTLESAYFPIFALLQHFANPFAHLKWRKF